MFLYNTRGDDDSSLYINIADCKVVWKTNHAVSSTVYLDAFAFSSHKCYTNT